MAGACAYAAIGRPGALRWWLAVGLMLDWHLGMVETEDGEPRPLGAADAATLVRAWLVPVVARDPSAVALAVGHLSDVADGRLARASVPTRLGRDLEGVVDACFAIAALRGLSRSGALSDAAAGAEVLRLATGLVAATAAWFGAAAPPDPGVLHAARGATPVRSLGTLLAARGHRRSGSVLVVLGSAASTGLLVGRLSKTRTVSSRRDLRARRASSAPCVR